MPARVEECVQALLDDPDFKPRKPDQSKEDAAWATCTWMEDQGLLRGNWVWRNSMGKPASGPFRIVLPITGARRRLIEKAGGAEEVVLSLHVEASGPERDGDGDRMSERALEKMVSYADEKQLMFLDGHYQDLLSAMLGDVKNPYLTEEKHFAFDVELKSDNPFAVQLFNDVLAGKKHGASIAGIVHEAEIEEYEEDTFGNIFHDVELIEVSRTSWPSWRDSFITLVASKVGKLPAEEYASIVKRRDMLIGEENMRVKTAGGGEEIWEPNDTGDLVVKIISPHGWDKKFSISNEPWADVKDRSKPCQYAIIVENEDGSFSVSKSGYPHHLPDCDTINRAGVIAAAGRLVQAMKATMPEIETPPIETLVTDRIGTDWLAEIHKKKFSADQLKYAAKHILRHYRRDMDAEPPENLVEVAKTYDSEEDEIISLIKGLVHVIDKSAPITEGIMNEQDTVVKTPVVESTDTDVTETETETAAPVEAQPDIEAPVEPEVDSEPADVIPASRLSKVVEGRLLATQFGELLYTMQEMVGEAIQASDLDGALTVMDEFAQLGKAVLADLVKTEPSGVKLSFLLPFESRLEMVTGQLTRSRVERAEQVIDALLRELGSLRQIFQNTEIVEDGGLPATPDPETETKTASMAKFEERLQEIEAQQKTGLTTLAETLTAPSQREQPGHGDTEPVVVELSDEEHRQNAFDRFGKSARLQ